MDFALILFIALVITGCFAAWDRFVRRPRLEREGGIDNKEPLLIEYSKAFFPVILIVFVLRSFVLEPFRIPSGSMLPTLYHRRLHTGQQIHIRHQAADHRQEDHRRLGAQAGRCDGIPFPPR